MFFFSAKLKLTVNRVLNNFPRLAPDARSTTSSDWFLAVFRGAVIGYFDFCWTCHVSFFNAALIVLYVSTLCEVVPSTIVISATA